MSPLSKTVICREIALGGVVKGCHSWIQRLAEAVFKKSSNWSVILVAGKLEKVTMRNISNVHISIYVNFTLKHIQSHWTLVNRRACHRVVFECFQAIRLYISHNQNCLTYIIHTVRDGRVSHCYHGRCIWKQIKQQCRWGYFCNLKNDKPTWGAGPVAPDGPHTQRRDNSWRVNGKNEELQKNIRRRKNFPDK